MAMAMAMAGIMAMALAMVLAMAMALTMAMAWAMAGLGHSWLTTQCPGLGRRNTYSFGHSHSHGSQAWMVP